MPYTRRMDTNPVWSYVLVSANMDSKGNVHEAIVGVTTSVFDAEKHRDASIQNDFKGPFALAGNFQDAAVISDLALSMRDFTEEIVRQNAEALA